MKIQLLLFGAALAGLFTASNFFEKKKLNPQVVENRPANSEGQRVESNFSKMEEPENPIELGKVAWLRDFELATERAKKEQKPLLILFQEVPGCATCTRYGSLVLSHPLLVEAIETWFVPLCIFNNKGGSDRETLEKFNEPAWNNPVVRIISTAKNEDVTPRISGNYSPNGLAEGILLALKKTGKTPPIWLENLEKELNSIENGPAEAIFSMPCFWTGEGKLGEMDGVISTEAGFMDGREVVKVGYDARLISYENLVKKSQEVGCAGKVFCQKSEEKRVAATIVGEKSVAEKSHFRADRASKYYLRQTPWRFVPMTPMQTARANSLVGKSDSPEPVLSPRQIELGRFAAENGKLKWPNALDEADFKKAWGEASKIKTTAN